MLDEFEGEANVVVIQAKDFLESLRQLGITQLNELEIACLMRVLSKPELDHAILLAELTLVLENFGLQQEKEENTGERKKQKINKKKQMREAVNGGGDDRLYTGLREVVARVDVGRLMELVRGKSYEQAVKTKKKEIKMELIRRDDFYSVVKEATHIDLHSGVETSMERLLQIDGKYADIFQVKGVKQLMAEVVARYELEEKEKKVMEEFYKEDDKGGKKEQVDVLNFEEVMGEEEERQGKEGSGEEVKQS